jgi:2,5-diamino-6-(ribosylamino)-4(3H)-pyrimidinone 5'-phosphate reductase
MLQALVEESARGTPIIVEGKKDLETLRTLGVHGLIVTAKTGGKSRLDVLAEIEKLCSREVILLLDFDRRGKEWTAVLRENLEKARIKVNVTFRKELLKSAGRELKDIEGLAAYLETLSKKLGER